MYTAFKIGLSVLVVFATSAEGGSSETNIAWGFGSKTGFYGVSESADCDGALSDPAYPSLWHPGGRGNEAAWCNGAVGDISWRAGICDITPETAGFALSGREEGCDELGQFGGATLVRCGGTSEHDPCATEMLKMFAAARKAARSKDSDATGTYAVVWTAVTGFFGACALNLGCHSDRRTRCWNRAAVWLCCAEGRPESGMAADHGPYK